MTTIKLVIKLVYLTQGNYICYYGEKDNALVRVFRTILEIPKYAYEVKVENPPEGYESNKWYVIKEEYEVHNRIYTPRDT